MTMKTRLFTVAEVLHVLRLSPWPLAFEAGYADAAAGRVVRRTPTLREPDEHHEAHS